MKLRVFLGLAILLIVVACAPPSYWVEEGIEAADIKVIETSPGIKSVEVRGSTNCITTGKEGPIQSREQRGFSIQIEKGVVTYSYDEYENVTLPPGDNLIVEYEDGLKATYQACHMLGLFYTEEHPEE